MTSYILLSAGIGRGMMTKGTKSLLKFDGVKVLDYQVDKIRAYDANADILVVIGFNADKIVKHVVTSGMDVRLIYNSNYKITSQTESLRLAVNAIRSGAYYIIHGDMVFNAEALKVKKSQSSIVVIEQSDTKNIGVVHSSGVLLNMSYGLDNAWGQIAYISPSMFAASKELLNSFKSNKQTYEFINMLSQKDKFMVTTNDKAKIVEITKDYEGSYT